jgi:hypothetical protein
MNALTAAYIHLQALELAHEVYDFTLCQRRDGSFYGTAGQCRKGVEAQHDEKDITRESIMAMSPFSHLTGEKRETANKYLNALTDEEFANVTSQAAEMLLQKPSPKVGVMTPAMVEGIKSRAEILKAAEKDPSVLIDNLKKISDKEVEAMWSILTPKLQTKISNPNVVKGLREGTNMTLDQARKALLKRWMEQDSIDPFTGRRVNFIETELEHILSFNDLRGDAHSIKNLIWIQRDVNQQKLDTPLGEFVKKVQNTSSESAKAKYEEAVNRTNKKGLLKTRVKEDIKLLRDQADRLIQEYGNYSYYFLRESGFDVVIKQPGATRPRSIGWTRNITDESGKTVKFENAIIRKLPYWSPAQLNTARAIVNQYRRQMERGEVTIPEGNQLIYNAILNMGGDLPSFTPKQKSPSKLDKLDELLAQIRAS